MFRQKPGLGDGTAERPQSPAAAHGQCFKMLQAADPDETGVTFATFGVAGHEPVAELKAGRVVYGGGPPAARTERAPLSAAHAQASRIREIRNGSLRTLTRRNLWVAVIVLAALAAAAAIVMRIAPGSRAAAPREAP